MEPLIIPPTSKSPAIELKTGELNFKGCSIHSDPKTFFAPVEEWINDYISNAPDETQINIKFEYIDSASVKSLFEILSDLEKLSKEKKVKVNWFYDFNDPEILELGEIIHSKVKIDFKFIEES